MRVGREGGEFVLKTVYLFERLFNIPLPFLLLHCLQVPVFSTSVSGGLHRSLSLPSVLTEAPSPRLIS